MAQATITDPDIQANRAGDLEKGSNMGWNSDNNKKLRLKKWHIEGDILCFNNQRYIPPGLLRHEFLKLHHNNPWTDYFGHK